MGQWWTTILIVPNKPSQSFPTPEVRKYRCAVDDHDVLYRFRKETRDNTFDLKAVIISGNPTDSPNVRRFIGCESAPGKNQQVPDELSDLFETVRQLPSAGKIVSFPGI